MNHTDLATFLKSNRLVKLLAVLGALIIALFIFEAGMLVGLHKASFAYHWEENYEHNFGSPGGMMGGIANPHGVSGKIVSVSLPTFVVAGHDSNEQTVQISDDTIVRDGNTTVDASDLAAGKFVTVIGSPSDDGVVTATFVRVMPAPRTATSTATSTNQN